MQTNAKPLITKHLRALVTLQHAPKTGPATDGEYWHFYTRSGKSVQLFREGRGWRVFVNERATHHFGARSLPQVLNTLTTLAAC